MTRTTLLLVVFLAATALLVPTGAVGVSSPSGTDPAPQLQDIEMAPADGPNGAYAVLDGNKQIAILLSGENPNIEAEGINVDAVARFESVFTISYTGDESADVWLTDEVDDVRFFGGEDAADSIEGRENNVTLEPGESLRVGLRVDTTGDYRDVENMDGFTVHANLANQDDSNSNAVVVGSSDEASAATSSTNPTSTPTPTPTSTATATPTDSTPEDTPIQTTTSAPEADSGSETTRTQATTEAETTSTGEEQRNAQLLGGFGLPAPLALLAAVLLTGLLLGLWRRRTDDDQE